MLNILIAKPSYVLVYDRELEPIGYFTTAHKAESVADRPDRVE